MSRKISPLFTKKAHSFSLTFSKKNYKYCKVFLNLSISSHDSYDDIYRTKKKYQHFEDYSDSDDSLPSSYYENVLIERKLLNYGTNRRPGKQIKYIYKLIIANRFGDFPSLDNFNQYFDLKRCFKTIKIIQETIGSHSLVGYLGLKVKYLSWADFRKPIPQIDNLYYQEKSLLYRDVPNPVTSPNKPGYKYSKLLLMVHPLRGIEKLTFNFMIIWDNLKLAYCNGDLKNVDYDTQEQRTLRYFLYCVLDGYFPNLKTILFQKIPEIYIWLWKELIDDIEERRHVKVYFSGRQISEQEMALQGYSSINREWCRKYFDDENNICYYTQYKEPELPAWVRMKSFIAYYEVYSDGEAEDLEAELMKRRPKLSREEFGLARKKIKKRGSKPTHLKYLRKSMDYKEGGSWN